MTQLPAITVSGLSKRYRLGHSDPTLRELLNDLRRSVAYRLRGQDRPDDADSHIWALKGVSFSIAHGERIGIIGRNGAGKSTLLKILSRVVSPTAGEARLRGRVTSLLEVGTGFNDEMTGRQNIYLNAGLHGLRRNEIDMRLEEIIEFSEVRRFIDTPVKFYSSGMRMRLAFSIVAHLDPDILILDEVLAVGDLAFQQKCLARMDGLTASGRTLLFVSHSLDAVNRFCDRCLWLDDGRLKADGEAREITGAYLEQFMGLRSSVSFSAPDDALAPASEPASAQEDKANPTRPSEAEEPVRVLAARITDREGAVVDTVSVDREVGIEVTFQVLKDGADIEPALHVKTRSTLAFVSAFTPGEGVANIRRRGVYRATAWIPANLLNTGMYYVNIAMVTPDPLVRHVSIDDAVSFNVFDPLDATATARGRYGRDFPGFLRPKLAWSVATDASTAQALA